MNLLRVNNKNTRRTSLTSLLLTLNTFHTLFWQIFSHLIKKSLTENFFVCAVRVVFIDFLGNYTTIAFMIWDPIRIQNVTAKNHRSHCKATGPRINSKTEFHLVVIPSRLHF